ncbi:RNA polymerase sigma-70 factor [Flagellimonas sp. HMM57]|uniref:RNA polymerase sigma factor n=1 Tax=unclassified Flagellimonas TaxID=2644544 RepID=UPI0013D14DC6|nr:MULTISPECIES: RNA polymerase sigma-70 factor [unclassified Flagellimonas]UII77661.1 RNA polymerase sigma-70 factor [Flagellimonas sp. HMM57]
MDFKNDILLAKRLSSGDSKAYDYLMDSFYQNLCVYAYSLTGDDSKAEDLVQNVFVKLWINRKKINPKYAIKNFLYKSVYNEFIDDYRKNKPVIYLEKKYLEAIDLVVENDERNFDELIKLVHKEIENLPKKCKRIFLLSKKEGLTHLEISELLGVSVKTVEGHMSRAFKTLGEKLGPKIEAALFLLFDFRRQLHQLS